jgi:hypothetical protein
MRREGNQVQKNFLRNVKCLVRSYLSWSPSSPHKVTLSRIRSKNWKKYFPNDKGIENQISKTLGDLGVGPRVFYAD